MYCEKCDILFEENVRPVCGNKKVREPADDDPCFLVEKEMMWGDMLADVLKQNGIPFFYKRTLGAGLALRAGPMFERYIFFVPYAQLSKAKDIVEGMFSETQAE